MLLLLLLGVAACTPVAVAPAGDDSGAASAEPVTIRVRTDVANDEEILNEIIAQFEELHPNIDVELEMAGYTSPTDRMGQIRTMFAAEAEPDIMYFWDQFFSNFVAAIVNDTDESHTLRIELGEGSSSIPLTVRVPAKTTISLGAEGEDPILVEDLDTPAGADIPGYFQSGDAEGTLIPVPVLDGELPYLAPLVPSEAEAEAAG